MSLSPIELGPAHVASVPIGVGGLGDGQRGVPSFAVVPTVSQRWPCPLKCPWSPKLCVCPTMWPRSNMLNLVSLGAPWCLHTVPKMFPVTSRCPCPQETFQGLRDGLMDMSPPCVPPPCCPQGYEVHVTPSVHPEPKLMRDIITCSGGTFLPTMPRTYGVRGQRGRWAGRGGPEPPGGGTWGGPKATGEGTKETRGS